MVVMREMAMKAKAKIGGMVVMVLLIVRAML